MAHAEITETVAIDKDRFFDTVVGYERYPEFVDGSKRVEVKRESPSKAVVTYYVSMMKDIDYTLEHLEDRENGVITWKLLKSGSLKENTGRWEIKAAGPGSCTIKYSIDIEFSIPVPGFILSRLVKTSLPSMIRSFEKQAKRG